MSNKIRTLRFIVHFSIASVATAGSIVPETTSGWSGTVGAGPMFFSKYTGGTGTTSQIFPLVSASYNDILYIEPLRANVYLASNADKTVGIGLAVEPRMGFHSSDGARLTGMATRRHSLEGGPNVDWDTGFVTISLSYLVDLTHASGGTSSRLYFYKDVIKNEKWKLGANVGIDRMSAKVANYYFGVAADEATASRPMYQPGSTSNIVAGVDGSYKMTQRTSVVFGLQETRLRGGAANSPIVETKQATTGWLGLAWNL